MQASSSSLDGTRRRSLMLDLCPSDFRRHRGVVAPATYEIRASDEPYGLHVSCSVSSRNGKKIKAEQSKRNPPNWSAAAGTESVHTRGKSKRHRGSINTIHHGTEKESERKEKNQKATRKRRERNVEKEKEKKRSMLKKRPRIAHGHQNRFPSTAKHEGLLMGKKKINTMSVGNGRTCCTTNS